MKANISLVLNAILLLAVIYLFTKQPAAAGPDKEAEPAATTTDGPKFVYIDADTLLEKYDYFRQQKEALEKREADATEKLAQRGRALESQYRQVQEKIQKGLLTPNQIAEEEQRLGRQQQVLMDEREKLSQELLGESQRVNTELQEKLKSILDGLRAEKGYAMILQFGQGSSLLNASEALDITEEVLTILNKKGVDGEEKDTSSSN
ncbi:MAG: OmpH family outer membrane protein [Phaeodactylibacter sp.]|nr:OmpH family outer membrane protein [Phaeodactylibacter sp.]MCB9275447.1 OmpH family outer membrane protein [Lewinellaceae bacterium]